ncbi:hypothetical protein ACROYT_G027861 [Oculina patagonica]
MENHYYDLATFMLCCDLCEMYTTVSDGGGGGIEAGLALVIFQWLDLERIVMQVALVVLTVLVVDCCCCVGAGGSEAGDTCSVSGCGEAGDNETGGVDGASGRLLI